MEIKKEQILMRLGLLEQEAGRFQEQIQVINQQINDFENLKLSLDKISKTKGHQILAPLGGGIFFNSEIKDKKLFVNVGCGIIIKKTPKQTSELIDKQKKELGKIKEKLLNEIERINLQMQEVIAEVQKQKN